MKFSEDMVKAFANYNHLRLSEKLADIRDNFEDYFDEDDNVPAIAQGSFDNVGKLLELCDDNCLNSWNIEPYTNGTLMLVSQNNDSVINIGVSRYSCNIVIDGRKIKRNPTDFSAQEVASLVMKYYIFNNYTFEAAGPTWNSGAHVPNFESDFNVISRYAFAR